MLGRIKAAIWGCLGCILLLNQQGDDEGFLTVYQWPDSVLVAVLTVRFPTILHAV